MKLHTTNYINTFIEVAEDCPAVVAEIPLPKGKQKTVAEMQWEMIRNHPYQFTSDDVLFQVYADRNDLTAAEYVQARAAFFSKGQPCLRASPLTKRYGYGVHADQEGKVAVYGRETQEYAQFVNDPHVSKVKAMRASRK